MPGKKRETKEEKEAKVLDSYESWLKKRPVKKARATAGDISRDEEEKR